MHIKLSRVEMRLPEWNTPLFALPSLDILPGARILVHGPSGSGKTTLLHLLCGQFLPHAGTIRVGDTELTSLSGPARARFRRKHFGIIFQRANLIEHLTVLENVLLGFGPGISNAVDRASGRTRDLALKAVNSMGLEALADTRAGLLSPGEQQRVAIARVCAAYPDIILADEPTSSLDLPNAELVMNALWDASRGKTLVVVSHDPRILPRFEVVHDFAALVGTT